MIDLALYSLAGDVLAAVEAYYLAEGVALPERRYVSDGTPAWDCEQVTVTVNRTAPIRGDVRTDVASEMWPYEFGRAAEMSIEVVRCAPMVDSVGEGEAIPPDVAAIEASAMTKLADAEMVLLGLLEASHVGGLTGCHGVTFLGWTSRGPEGGLTGGETVVRLAIE